MNPDKDRIRLRFEKALTTYEHEALVQHAVGERLLLDLALAFPQFSPQRALEVGCCTGMFTEQIIASLPSLKQLSVCDLVAAFEHCIQAKACFWRQEISFLAGDIEQIALPDCYDLILSSSTLHWAHDFPRLCQKFARHLVPDGVLALSLYGPDNLCEIRQLSGLGLQYLSLDELRAILEPHFEVHRATESRERLWFSTPMAVLRHLRATGVNSLSWQPWTKGRLRQFSAAYEASFQETQGVPLTYHPLFFVARRREGAFSPSSL